MITTLFLWFVILNFIIIFSPVAIGHALDRPNRKALPEYDEKGHKTEYDPHYTRAREIELGTDTALLTTCDQKGCQTCSSTTLVIAPVVLDAPELEAPEVDTSYAEEFIRQVEQQNKIMKIALELEDEYTKDYSVSDFKPANVPARAAVQTTEVDSMPVITWSWDNERYIKKMKEYVLHTEDQFVIQTGSGEEFPVTNTTLRKRRWTFNELQDLSIDAFTKIVMNDPKRWTVEVGEYSSCYEVNDRLTGESFKIPITRGGYR